MTMRPVTNMQMFCAAVCRIMPTKVIMHPATIACLRPKLSGSGCVRKEPSTEPIHVAALLRPSRAGVRAKYSE